MSNTEIPEPRKVKSHGVPDVEIGEALKKTKGLMFMAGELCGISGQTVSERVKKSPYLQQIVDEGREKRLDKAEFNLAEMTEEKELGAICFLLKTLGKSRGYVENKEAQNFTPDQKELADQVWKWMNNKQNQSGSKICDNTSIKE